jgi:predicted O-methyltransferase YrrM
MLSTLIVGIILPILAIGAIAVLLCLRADMRRRRLKGKPLTLLTTLDLAAPAALFGLATVYFAYVLEIVLEGLANETFWLLADAFAWTTAALIVWNIGSSEKLEAGAPGRVFAIALIAGGAIRIPIDFIHPRTIRLPWISVFLGGLLLSLVTRRFRKQSSEHRILQHAAAQGDVLQPEYHRATPECPEPERWRMYDSMTAEYEVLAFLQQLIETLKPKIIVETGTFMGISTLKLAEGLRANGAGKVITCEYDPIVYAKAIERIEASGLKEWIDARNESSLEMKIDGQIDLLFSDSEPELREAEVRRYLPMLRPNGIILIHDASSHLKTVREAALKLEREGLISVVLLPTPRGLVIAQKREHRTE